MPKPPLPPDLQEFLARPNPCVIGTLRPDGAPHTVATWYLWEDGRVLVNMDEGRARLEYLRRDPRVSLTVLDGDDWYRHVSLRGRVVSLEDDEDLVEIDRLSQQYRGQPYRNRSAGGSARGSRSRAGTPGRADPRVQRSAWPDAGKCSSAHSGPRTGRR